MKGKSNIQIQGIGFLLTITGLLKILWNKLFPELFGTKKITYWQSVMLYLICKALFDFRYNIKDSFNFGNNTINGDKSEKKEEKNSCCEAEEKESEVENEIEIEVKEEEENNAPEVSNNSEVEKEDEISKKA